MASYQVEWIDKPGGSNNPRTRIERLGDDKSPNNKWRADAQDVIRWINAGTHTFNVTDNNGNSTVVEVGHREGVPYLRTKSDGTPLDNLLSLRNVSTIR